MVFCTVFGVKPKYNSKTYNPVGRSKDMVKLQLHVVKLKDGDVIEVPSVDNLVAIEAAGTLTAKLFYLEEIEE